VSARYAFPSLQAATDGRSGWAARRVIRHSAYDYAEQVLASQRKFADEVLKTTAPMHTGQDDAPAR
jgi:hypothetical protein